MMQEPHCAGLHCPGPHGDSVLGPLVRWPHVISALCKDASVGWGHRGGLGDAEMGWGMLKWAGDTEVGWGTLRRAEDAEVGWGTLRWAGGHWRAGGSPADSPQCRCSPTDPWPLSPPTLPFLQLPVGGPALAL